MSQDRVRRLFSDPKFLADYSAWLKDGVTKQIFEAASELAEPQSLSRPDPNAALYMHGVYVGFGRMLAFLKSADKAVQAAEQDQAEETYGADRILREELPALEAAKKRRTKAPVA